MLPEALSANGSVVAVVVVVVENCYYSGIIGAFGGSTIERSSVAS